MISSYFLTVTPKLVLCVSDAETDRLSYSICIIHVLVIILYIILIIYDTGEIAAELPYFTAPETLPFATLLCDTFVPAFSLKCSSLLIHPVM